MSLSFGLSDAEIDEISSLCHWQFDDERRNSPRARVLRCESLRWKWQDNASGCKADRTYQPLAPATPWDLRSISHQRGHAKRSSGSFLVGPSFTH